MQLKDQAAVRHRRRIGLGAATERRMARKAPGRVCDLNANLAEAGRPR